MGDFTLWSMILKIQGDAPAMVAKMGWRQVFPSVQPNSSSTGGRLIPPYFEAPSWQLDGYIGNERCGCVYLWMAVHSCNRSNSMNDARCMQSRIDVCVGWRTGFNSDLVFRYKCKDVLMII